MVAKVVPNENAARYGGISNTSNLVKDRTYTILADLISNNYTTENFMANIKFGGSFQYRKDYMIIINGPDLHPLLPFQFHKY